MAEVTWFRWDDMPKERVSEMLDRRLITGDRMMLAHVYGPKPDQEPQGGDDLGTARRKVGQMVEDVGKKLKG